MNPMPFCLVIASLLATCLAQEPSATKPTLDPEKLAQARKQLLGSLAEQGITLDFEKETVAIPAWVNDPPPPDPIEYVLVHRRGKKHEAVLVTDVKASLLNGALMLLGFREGKNATYKERDPAPTREEVEKGAPIADVLPPEGMRFWMTVVRETAEGKRQEDPVEEYLIDLGTQRPVEDAKWIYLGGRMAQLYRNEPAVFLGDYEGNLVSACYMSPENHIGTISHPRGPDEHNWVPNGAVVPPPGTKVTLVFHKKQPEPCRKREERIDAARKKDGAASRPTRGKSGEPVK